MRLQADQLFVAYPDYLAAVSGLTLLAVLKASRQRIFRQHRGLDQQQGDAYPPIESQLVYEFWKLENVSQPTSVASTGPHRTSIWEKMVTASIKGMSLLSWVPTTEYGTRFRRLQRQHQRPTAFVRNVLLNQYQKLRLVQLVDRRDPAELVGRHSEQDQIESYGSIIFDFLVVARESEQGFRFVSIHGCADHQPRRPATQPFAGYGSDWRAARIGAWRSIGGDLR